MRPFAEHLIEVPAVADAAAAAGGDHPAAGLRGRGGPRPRVRRRQAAQPREVRHRRIGQAGLELGQRCRGEEALTVYGVWTPEQVATAEEPVLARTPEGALMRRAAYGAAQVALRMLAEAPAASRDAACVVLVGAGNNGGDGLWAGVELRRRGVGGHRGAARPRPRPPRRARRPARRPAAGWSPRSRRASRRCAGRPGPRRASSAPPGGAGCGAGAAARGAADAADVPILAVDSPSGVDPLTGTVTPGRHRRRDRHVRRAQAGARAEPRPLRCR